MSDNPVEQKAAWSPTTTPPKHGAVRQVVEFIATIAIAFLVAQAVRTWVIQPYVVPTGSMLPTIQLGDQVLANKFIYRFRAPSSGDVVVFDNPMPEPGQETLIKRVIAVGGQTVDLKNGQVTIDGVPKDEPYTYGQPSEPLNGSRVSFPIYVPLGYIWLMGDNRTSSQDSRWFGPVKLSAVQGQAFFTYWPLSRIGQLN